MANITITVQSFLNASITHSITIDNAQTVAQLKTDVNGVEGTPTALMNLYLNGTLLVDASTLAASGLITSSYVKTSNNLTESGLWTKEQRQDYKLQLAALKRTLNGNARDTYDITQLPDTYNGNVSGADDNANVGGLVVGRPWV